MYSVTFIFRNSSVTQGFVFKKDDSAHRLKDQADESMLNPSGENWSFDINDDYGCHGVIDLREVAGVIVNDVAKEYEKANEFRKLEQLSMQPSVRTAGIMSPLGNTVLNQWDGKKS